MAGKLDLEIDQGATFSRTFTWKAADGAPVDLTGYGARLQVRETYGSEGALVDLASTAGDALSVGGANGVVALTLPAGVTGAIEVPDDGSDLPQRRLVYDLEVSNRDYVKRLVYGAFILRKAVTR